jgi:sec-independent protein translocase protein TatC
MAEPAPTLVDSDHDPSRMPFLDHLRDLRTRLRNAIIALVIGFAATYTFKEDIFVFLLQPLLDVWTARQVAHPELGPPVMNFGSLIEPFWTYFSQSLWAGTFFAAPLVFHQLWQFIAPGLYAHEKRVALPFAAFSWVCFVGGAAFCYYMVLPVAIEFLIDFSSANLSSMSSSLLGSYQVGLDAELKPQLFMQPYLDFTKKLMIGFGLVFELPLVVLFLSLIGAVTHRGMWKFNRWAIVLCFVVAAILTPPDWYSQVMMACPLVVLYNLSILISWGVTVRRERREAALAG